MVFTTIAKAGGPTRRQMKSRQKRSEPVTHILVDGKTYSIQWTTLRNLAIDNYDAVEKRSAQYGQDDIGSISRKCYMCNYNPENVVSFMMSGCAKPNFGDDSCSYQPRDVRVAIEIKERSTGKKFYAESPCVIEESMVKVLHEKGLLENYRTHVLFNFRPLSDFEKKLANPDDFPIQKSSKIDRILDVLRL
jgi:hypothetical protein